MRVLTAMRGPMHHLRADERGVAFVEFALIAPVLLFLILGGLEVVNYALAQLKVNQIAMTVADNAGRVTTGIDEANVYEVFAGANVIGQSMDFQSKGRIVLSSLQDNEQKGGKHGQMINWQRCWGDLATPPAYGAEGAGRKDNSLAQGMGATGNKITSIPGTAVMFVEVSYDYQPLISKTIVPVSGTIRRESAFNVRGRQNNNISNAQGLKVQAC
jgi:Flp pilus assembly pilin Flp